MIRKRGGPTPAAESPGPRPESASDYFGDKATYDRMVLLAWRLIKGGTRDDAMAVVHEVFIACEKHWSSIETPSRYIVTCILNNTRSRPVLAWRERDAIERAEQDRTRRNHDGPDAVKSEHDWAVDRAVEDLPRRQRECVVLSHYYGFSQREIAVLLDIHPGTVARSMRSADAKLRRILANFQPSARPSDAGIVVVEGVRHD